MTKALKGFGIFLICTFVAACNPLNNAPVAPQAIEGIIQLQGWDFKKQGTISLSGEWAFHWQELLLPDQINASSNFEYVSVPDNWTSYQIGGQDLPADGFATYNLTIQFPSPSQVYGLFIEGQGTAYNLWVDGKLVAQNGRVATNSQDMIPQSKPHVTFFQTNDETVEIVIQISNWQHRKAGFRNEILLGLPEQIHEYRANEMSREAALMGIYLVMALYHLFIYAFRPSNKGPLYFSLFGLIYFIRTGLLNQKILVLLLPALSWDAALRLEYLTFYLVAPIYALFIQSLYPKDVPPWTIRIISGLAAGFIVYMLLIDTLSLSYTTTAYQGILLIETAYFVYFIGRIVARKREGAFYIAFGSSVVFIGAIVEILSLQKIIPIEVDGTGTFLVFILVQAIMLSSRLSKSFSRVEVLSSELEQSNASLRESEKKYRSIFEESNDMIFIAGLDEQLKDANPATQEILGYSLDELMAMKLSDLVIYAKDKEQIKSTLFRQAIVKDYEVELKHKKGHIIHGLANLTFRKDSNGTITDIQGNVHDISSRKEVEAERLRAIQFEQLAITDPLTKAYNRRLFDEIANKELERAKRSGSLLTLAIFDIDHFKKVNDTHGHLIGDNVLVNLAKLCQSNMRSMDIFSR